MQLPTHRDIGRGNVRDFWRYVIVLTLIGYALFLGFIIACKQLGLI